MPLAAADRSNGSATLNDNAAPDPVLELRGITKAYPGVLANDRVSLRLGRGEVLGLLGENGAGKSTLMNIVSGLVPPDRGEICIYGEQVAIRSPRDSIGFGVGMVHQHFLLVPTLTVVENVVLGDQRLPRGRLPIELVARSVRRLADQLELPVDPDAVVGTLGIGAQQRVEIVKALYRDARILILDEPTAVLSASETDGLFRTIRNLVARGVAVILISHKLDDIFAICDRVMVMRNGRAVADRTISDVTQAELVRLMVGEDIVMPSRPSRWAGSRPVLAVRELCVAGSRGESAVDHASFDLHGGEILGLAGVEGNGQRELVDSLAGLATATAGEILIDSETPAARMSVRQRRRRGMRHVPADRGAHGMLAELSLGYNFLLSHVFAPLFNRWGMLRHGLARRMVQRSLADFDIRAPGAATRMDALSGGNQQKLVLAREFAFSPRILIAAQPTRGLDVRTIAFVRRALLDQRRAGTGILLVSSDLAEIWELADRVMVIAGGRIRGPVSIEQADLQQVGSWMAGR